MNAIRELRSTAKMSQNKFAAYLDIPVANIQHWEQGVTKPPAYVISLITRVMTSDGYLNNDLSPFEADAVRQTRATLALEQMFLDEQGASEIKKLVKGEISREDYQKQLREKNL